MRVKLIAITFGVIVAGLTLFKGFYAWEEDGLNLSRWVGLILLSAAMGVAVTVLYVYMNRFLHKRGLSLFDDEDFEE